MVNESVSNHKEQINPPDVELPVPNDKSKLDKKVEIDIRQGSSQKEDIGFCYQYISARFNNASLKPHTASFYGNQKSNWILSG